jgi:hypothetical protein
MKNPDIYIGGHNRPRPTQADAEPGKTVSIIRNETTGIMVSISRAIKTGKTADESTKVKLEGWAHDLPAALDMLQQMDIQTQLLIKSEALLFGLPCPYIAEKPQAPAVPEPATQ